MICGGSTFTNYFLCSQKSRAQLFVFNFQSYLNTIIEREISKKKHLQNWNRALLISKEYCKWLYFNPTLHGGTLCPPPYQLWSLTAQTGRLILVQSSYKFGHMGTNYGQDPNIFFKCQQCLSYASCDDMIKNSPYKVGLRSSNILINSLQFPCHFLPSTYCYFLIALSWLSPGIK